MVVCKVTLGPVRLLNQRRDLGFILSAKESSEDSYSDINSEMGTQSRETYSITSCQDQGLGDTNGTTSRCKIQKHPHS